jgi:uncharacterized protein (DUF697 family)
MHDLDRTQSYYETEFEPEAFAYEDEYADEADFEFGDTEMALDEVEEMELAAQLLEITDETEIDQFLGSVFKKVAKVGGGFLKKAVGGNLGKFAKGLIKKALPIAGGALGSFIAPGIGTALGSRLGSAAGGIFGLELEGLSPQDQEYEVARRVVRLVGTAAKKAQQLQSALPPESAARKALIEAAMKHAPGLLQALGGFQKALGGFQFEAAPQGAPGGPNGYAQPGAGGGQRVRSGRWVRHGRRIILLGV